MKTIITADQLYRLMWSAPMNVVIFDCRHRLTDPDFGRRAYVEERIPGARYAHLEDDLSGAIEPGVTGRHPLPKPAEFVRFLETAGVSDKTQIVAYDDIGGAVASRFWWMCRWIGHDLVAVLDGGFAAWLGSGFEVESGTMTPVRPGRLTPTIRTDMVVDAETVARAQNAAVIDARAAERFEGRNETIDPVAGHIPGATSLPFSGNLTGSGLLKTPEELRSRYSTLGKTEEPPIVYCGSGVTAAHIILAMVHAGLPEPRLYVGSWSDWITNPDRPIETGPTE